MNTLQRRRRTHAAILTAIAGAILLGIGGSLGLEAAILAAITLPLPLVVLWVSADVIRADEAALASQEPARRRPLPSSAARTTSHASAA